MRLDDIPLTASDVERLAQIANSMAAGDALGARRTLIQAVTDRSNFTDEAAFEHAKRVAEWFR